MIEKSTGIRVAVMAASLSAMASAGLATESLKGNTMMIDGHAGKIATYRKGAGNGLAVVLVHGDSGRASQWDGVVEQLRGDGPVVAFDGRGHGASDPATDGDYGYDARAGDLAAVVGAMELGDLVVVAHSGGAGVALQYAMENPETVRGVFLVDPATDPRGMPEEMRAGFLAALDGPGGLPVVQGYYASIAGDDATVVARVQDDAAAVDATARLGVAKALAYWNPEPVLSGYAGPVAVLVTQANDTETALYHLREGMTVSVLETTGHWPHLDTPDVVAEAITQFMLGVQNK